MAKPIERFGIAFPTGTSDQTIWLWRYAHDKRSFDKGGPNDKEKWEAFKKCVDLLWNTEESTRRVIWNPWTEQMLRSMIEHRYVGLAGCGSSGKSDAAAVFALVEWLAAPTETLCLITSTTIEGAKKRVWKSVTELWNSLESQWKKQGKSMPGKILSSGNNAKIKGMDINGKMTDGLGISIVAADTTNDTAASKKLKGLKSPAEGRGRLRLIADEMPDLGHSVLVAAVGNLNSNPDFKCVALGNPRMKMDPFGEFCTPKHPDGYKSVTAMDNSWETKEGICIRFDATKSPRITEPDGDKKYPWQPGEDYISQIADRFGEDSAEFWSQVRGMWPPDGLDNSIWAEGELLNSLSTDIDHWDNPNGVQKVSALDIPYTSGGDRACFIWGECGVHRGVKKLKVLGHRILSEGLTEETFEKIRNEGKNDMTANLHLIRQYKQMNQQLGIAPRFSGFDATAGGKIFKDWVIAEWKPGCRAINFGTKPEERMTAYDETEAEFGNRVAQLWCQPKPLVRAGQILQIPKDVSMELCQRKFSDKQSNGKVYVEKKDEMRNRTGVSPDLADAFVMLVEVCILNGLLEFEEVKQVEKKEMKRWKDLTLGKQNPFTGKFVLGNAHPKRLSFKR